MQRYEVFLNYSYLCKDFYKLYTNEENTHPYICLNCLHHHQGTANGHAHSHGRNTCRMAYDHWGNRLAPDLCNLTGHH